MEKFGFSAVDVVHAAIKEKEIQELFWKVSI
jgi:hypothetical protein